MSTFPFKKQNDYSATSHRPRRTLLRVLHGRGQRVTFFQGLSWTYCWSRVWEKARSERIHAERRNEVGRYRVFMREAGSFTLPAFSRTKKRHNRGGFPNRDRKLDSAKAVLLSVAAA
jgi:hypothetical protein